jgi:hypothetical protein
MTENHMKKEAECPLDSYEGLIVSLKSAMQSSLWNETNRVKRNEVIRLLELLKTDILGKQV